MPSSVPNYATPVTVPVTPPEDADRAAAETPAAYDRREGPPIITPDFIGPRFPNFYAEMAYMDGFRGNAHAYVKWDEMCPVAAPWIRAGQMAAAGAAL